MIGSTELVDSVGISRNTCECIVAFHKFLWLKDIRPPENAPISYGWKIQILWLEEPNLIALRSKSYFAVILCSEFAHVLLELLASVFHILEEVKTGAAWAEQYCRSWSCHLEAFIDTVLHALDIDNRQSERVEVLV